MKFLKSLTLATISAISALTIGNSSVNALDIISITDSSLKCENFEKLYNKDLNNFVGNENHFTDFDYKINGDCLADEFDLYYSIENPRIRKALKIGVNIMANAYGDTDWDSMIINFKAAYYTAISGSTDEYYAARLWFAAEMAKYIDKKDGGGGYGYWVTVTGFRNKYD